MSRHTLKWTLEDFHTESSVEEKVQNANELAEIIQEQTGDNQYSAQCNGYSISGIYHADSDTLTSSNFPDAIATRIRE